jgi:EAL domain-containing protein (putative c-di-GMP-specific phosphodiesterase class I)/CheY-like chemotaxis protein
MREDTHGDCPAPAAIVSGSDERGHMGVCYVLDEDEQICHFLSLILHGKGVRTEEYSDGQSLLQAVDRRSPDLVFLNVSLDSSEAIHCVEALGKRGYFGFLQLMSDRGSAVLEHVKKVVDKNGLIALPVLPKPFRGEAIVKILHSLQLGDPAPVATRFGLDEALAKNWIEYWYQPKIDLRQKQLVGAEAFVRARHPEHGVVMPGAFLPGASDSDLVSLAEHSVISVLEAGTKYAELGLNLRLAINMSMNALAKLPIADMVRSHRSKYGNYSGFIIDIAEDQVMSSLDEVMEIAKKLREINVWLAIDDFGRAHTSLARLRESPFVELKLSRTYVADCATDKTRAPMCRTLIELAHNFDSVAVAVGIEKASEAVALVSMGCDHGQGFLLGQPMPEDRFLSLLKLRTGPKRTVAAAKLHH